MAAPEIINIRKVATLLPVGQNSARPLAQSGALPGFKVRGQWRSRRTDLDAWIESQTGGRAEASDRDTTQ